jgi:hypothetical protein
VLVDPLDQTEGVMVVVGGRVGLAPLGTQAADDQAVDAEGDAGGGRSGQPRVQLLHAPTGERQAVERALLDRAAADRPQTMVEARAVGETVKPEGDSRSLLLAGLAHEPCVALAQRCQRRSLGDAYAVLRGRERQRTL